MAAKKTTKTARNEPPPRPKMRPMEQLAPIERQTIEKIDTLARSAVEAVARGENPAMQMKMRALSNVSFNEKKRIIELGDKTQSREFFNTSMARKFMQTFLIANRCKELVGEGKTVSIRQMYYLTKHTLKGTSENTFEGQEESDPIIEDLEVTIDTLREELHLFANKRGLVTGNLVVNDAGDEIDLSKMGRGGWGIPSICEEKELKFVRNDAKFILLVEKQAVWHRLNEDRFWQKQNCILMTSEGQAARGVRRLLQRLSGELKLPVYCLVDNDPWGLYIYSVLKQGSINLAFESMRLAVPNVRFIGMSSLDYEKFDLPSAVEIKLSKEDIQRAQQMKKYPWFADAKWQREIDALLKNGFKMEVDSLLSKSIEFMTEEYLPKKLRDRDYLT